MPAAGTGEAVKGLAHHVRDTGAWPLKPGSPKAVLWFLSCHISREVPHEEFVIHSKWLKSPKSFL